MTPSRPYILRALYEWILDNDQTPHIFIDSGADGVSVPQQFVQDNRVTLNIAPTAVKDLRIGNDAVEFLARFGGKVSHIFIPVPGVLAIYAKETNKGMVFSNEDIENYAAIEDVTSKQGSGDNSKPNKPKLTLVKK